MRKLMFAAIACVLLACGVFIYSEWAKRDFERKLPQVPKPASQPVDSSDAAQDVAEATPTAPTVVDEHADGHHIDEEKPADAPQVQDTYDWRTEAAPPHPHTHQADPWTQLTREEEMKARGTWIEHPENMDPDELEEAAHLQRLERFGDIPEVHLYHQLMKKLLDGHLALDEHIAFVEVSQFLFPSESHRKTLVWLRWMKSKGVPEGMVPEPTEADLAYLMSHGIQVTRTPTTLTISTGP